ncbi:MAG: CoA pyrophosphatase [Solirubrobacteraceae bacterium]|nr:CoA pyrophosphatase [Solirubrobacteraceae bacterium]
MSDGQGLPTPQRLRELLERGPQHHELQIWRPADGDRPASVLVPLLTGDGELRVLVTRRSADLAKHAGEYSFPGGRPEPHDQDALATALRETEEEVGVSRELIEIVGALPQTSTHVTGYAITPFVGVIDASPTWVAQQSEVSEVAEPRLVDLVAAREVHTFKRPGGEAVDMPVFPIGPDRAIWGATARILNELLERLAPIVGAFPVNPDDADRPVHILGNRP